MDERQISGKGEWFWIYKAKVVVLRFYDKIIHKTHETKKILEQSMKEWFSG